MKQFKRVLSIVLCAALSLSLFAACKKTDGEDLGEVTYGRYVEEDISPEGLKGTPYSLVSFSDGSLDMVAMNWDEEGDKLLGYLRWNSKDNGSTWEKIDISWIDEYVNDYSEYYERGESPPEEHSLGSIFPCENGDVIYQVYHYVAETETQTGSFSNETFRRKQDGTQEPLLISEYEQMKTDGKTVNLGEVKLLPGERIFVNFYVEPTAQEMEDPAFNWATNDHYGVYSLTNGEKLYDLEYNGGGMSYNNTTLFLNDYEKGYLAINLQDGKPSTAPMPSNEMLQKMTMGGNMSNFFVDEKNNFFSVDARGMQKIVPEATETEQVMDGINYTYGSPLYGINASVYNSADESVILSLYESRSYSSDEGKLLRYTWDDKAIASSDKKIKVYSLHDNYFVRLALSEYKRKNPEVSIEYESAFDPEQENMAMHSARSEVQQEESGADKGGVKTEEDALRALNTELLNGTGPDVLILDGMPMESFVEKGVLEDLQPIVAANPDVLKQIFDPMTKDGKIYALPTNFQVPTLFGEKGYVEQFTDLDKLLAAIEGGASIPSFVEMDPDWTQQEQDAYYQKMFEPKDEKDQPVIYFESMDDIFNTFYASSAPAIFSEKGGINKENLTAFLQTIKKVGDKYELSEQGFTNQGEEMSGSMSMGYASYDYSQTLSRYSERQARLGYSRLGSYDILMNVAQSLHWSGQSDVGKGVVPAPNNDSEILDEAADVGEEDLPDEPASDTGENLSANTGSMDIQLLRAQPASIPDSQESQPDEADAGADVPPEADQVSPDPITTEKWLALTPDMILAPGLAKGTYFPSQIAGVTTTSKRPELARDFVATMLGEEVQKHNMGMGFPVTKAGFASQAEDYIRQSKYFVQEKIQLIDLDYEKLVSGLSTPAYTNEYLNKAMAASASNYCDGTMTIDEAVAKIVQETELYFAERQ